MIVPPEGIHLCVDLFGCDPRRLDSADFLSSVLREAAETAGATVLNSVSHAFDPQGVTILLLLAESHMSIHTWPETGYAAMDVFTCGPSMDPAVAYNELVIKLRAESVKVTIVSRGEAVIP